MCWFLYIKCLIEPKQSTKINRNCVKEYIEIKKLQKNHNFDKILINTYRNNLSFFIYSISIVCGVVMEWNIRLLLTSEYDNVETKMEQEPVQT